MRRSIARTHQIEPLAKLFEDDMDRGVWHRDHVDVGEALYGIQKPCSVVDRKCARPHISCQRGQTLASLATLPT